MASAFDAPIDIYNRALQHLGARRVTSITDGSKNAATVGACYDKLRQWELRRNVWRYATRRSVLRPVDTTTGIITPGTFDPTKTYLLGSVVLYSGVYYEATQSVSGAAGTPDVTQPPWRRYFGPLSVSQWAAGTNPTLPQPWNPATNYASGTIVIGTDGYLYSALTNGLLNVNPVTDGGVHWQKLGQAAGGPGYYSGELVYLAGSNTIYKSLTDSNTDTPGLLPQWVNTQVYQTGQTVQYLSVTYQSAQDFNVGNTPTGAGAWIAVPATQPDQMWGVNWLALGAASLAALRITYPAGSGPLSQSSTRNVFRLPNGFLREAPQSSKEGSSSWLGAPSGLQYSDWTYEGDLLISHAVDPIPYRFVCDWDAVAQMDAMFCETLAARIALEVCEDITQSTEKLQAVQGAYKKFGDEAREVNGIETGSVEPAEDDYITCRI